MTGIKRYTYLSVVLCALTLGLSGCGSSSAAGAGTSVAVSGGLDDAVGAIRQEAYDLLKHWTDGVLVYQVSHTDPSLEGGILCPACGRIHGRCGDFVLPLMYMAERTDDQKYLIAAKRLMRWMDNVKTPDGAWMNDINVSDWNGTTVFAAIALYEALEGHGEMLDDSTRMAWEDGLRSAGEFIYDNDIIFSRKRRENGWRNQNVNYSASGIYMLEALGCKYDKPEYIAKAREIALDLRGFFTENEGFLYGEGPQIYQKTPNGCLPVDLLYNVEESLPNMAAYCRMAGDTTLLKLVERSMLTHLEFMLPDGGWDNSWGTRSFKWAYWGGRTSDGFMPGYCETAGNHPEFMTAIGRNIGLLGQTTADGLLYGGANFREAGVKPCIHHTVGHAKALAAFLERADTMEGTFGQSDGLLPREKEYGVKHFKDINTWLVATGPWRATVTGFDAQYKIKGTHPMGGALSMLWHKEAGPLFAASINTYHMIEAPNMQADYQVYKMCGTPRVELMQDGVMYSNLDDLRAKTTCDTLGDGAFRFTVKAHLVDLNQKTPKGGEVPVELAYIFEKDGLSIQAKVAGAASGCDVRLVLPLIAAVNQQASFEGTGEHPTYVVGKDRCRVSVEALGQSGLHMLAVNANGRIYNMIPGFTFVPLAVPLSADDTGVLTGGARIQADQVKEI